MSIGSSGRIVVEIDPDQKKELYSALAHEGLSLKEWFIKNMNTFLDNKNQISLDFSKIEESIIINDASLETATAPTKEHLDRDASAIKVGEKLNEIDWSFIKRKIQTPLEKIHPYPAKFIGDIPRELIANIPIPEGTAVLDPFVGSGTSLVEAQRAGLPSIGIDLNPIACLISRVKTSQYPEGLQDAIKSVLDISKTKKTHRKSEIPNINHWFKPEIQIAVDAISSTISQKEYTPWRDHLKLILSSILVRVSNQDSDTRYAAVEKNIKYDDVFRLFENSSDKLISSLGKRSWNLTESEVLEANTLEVSPEQIKQPIGLVVTSPPYPNAYEYWLYHKYRMWWLGHNPISVKEKEIGARAHFFKKNGHTPELFLDQMSSTFSLLDKVLVQDGYACFVVGRSKIHGQVIDNGNIIQQAAKNHGLSFVTRIERDIYSQRKSFNLSHANIKTESILVFKKVAK
ncbi:DNA methyltransferase [Halomonas sp. SpR1]|uniref:DNA methyltransferase n=1 Tax=Halomonas sp. SpR1 TaxID=3050462 RepID=UPI0027E5A521|nr:DNA methyltransferase [Halomonas sp. SpR1]MDQ7733790.1 DNA methyltransferase [Halomonas sp. SpR1]